VVPEHSPYWHVFLHVPGTPAHVMCSAQSNTISELEMGNQGLCIRSRMHCVWWETWTDCQLDDVLRCRKLMRWEDRITGSI
jgi:hypothetical protein